MRYLPGPLSMAGLSFFILAACGDITKPPEPPKAPVPFNVTVQVSSSPLLPLCAVTWQAHATDVRLANFYLLWTVNVGMIDSTVAFDSFHGDTTRTFMLPPGQYLVWRVTSFPDSNWSKTDSAQICAT